MKRKFTFTTKTVTILLAILTVLFTIPFNAVFAENADTGSEECSHSYVLTEIINPTYTSEGYEIHTCQYCGKTSKSKATSSVVKATSTIPTMKYVVKSTGSNNKITIIGYIINAAGVGDITVTLPVSENIAKITYKRGVDATYADNLGDSCFDECNADEGIYAISFCEEIYDTATWKALAEENDETNYPNAENFHLFTLTVILKDDIVTKPEIQTRIVSNYVDHFDNCIGTLYGYYDQSTHKYVEDPIGEKYLEVNRFYYFDTVELKYSNNSAACSHKTNDSTTLVPAICTAAGTAKDVCTVCGYTRNVTVSATGHSYSAWKTTKAATCTSDGTQTKTCTKCGDTQTQTIAMLSHTDGNNDGNCDVCGVHFREIETTTEQAAETTENSAEETGKLSFFARLIEMLRNFFSKFKTLTAFNY